MIGERRVTAACFGALIGGALIWALETWVFTGGVPGIGRDFIDWLAPVLGALVSGWLAPHLAVDQERPRVNETSGAPDRP